MADIKDLGEERKKRAKSSTKHDKLGRSELFFHVVNKMNGSPLAPPDWPPFPRRFHYVADHAGRKTVLEEHSDGIVTYRDRDVAADAILQYCWEQIPFVPGAGIDAEAAGKCRNMWLGMTRSLSRRPDMLLERSQTGLTFKRLAFDAPAQAPTRPPPHFESLLARLSDPMAVCAFIGSLFYPDADRQQYLYLYGDGGDGKGALMRFLHGIFGDAAVSLSPPARIGDKFWNFNIYGKRLGLFYDCEDWDWFRSSHFKSLTGGDPILFEEKGRSGFTDTPAAKFIAASNSKPNVSSQSADMRRLIYISCMSLPRDQQIPNFENLLMAEAEDIVRTCKAIYLERCPNHGALDVEHALEVAWEAESYYIDAFNTYFVEATQCTLSGEQVTSKLKDFGIRAGKEISRTKKIWQRIFGVEIKETKRGTVYKGMGFKCSFMGGGEVVGGGE